MVTLTQKMIENEKTPFVFKIRRRPSSAYIKYPGFLPDELF